MPLPNRSRPLANLLEAVGRQMTCMNNDAIQAREVAKAAGTLGVETYTAVAGLA
uniref:Uncharacterized protein n=1 Tax=Hyaloperonospora arabidopsidis (strain Emoy2) TaxID=559515 RepID=M4BZD5_HYAAE